MTLFLHLSRRLLSAFGLALICALPAAYSLSAYAAELEGTPVPVDAAEPKPAPQALAVPVEIEAPDASAAAEPPPHSAADQHAHEMREAERWQRDSERQMRELGQDLSQAFEGGDGDDDGFHPALLIPILGILFLFGGPILLLALILVFFLGAKRRRQQDINMNIDKLLAAGRDIPIELLRGDEPKGPEESGSLAKGVRNICLGAGWLVFLTIAFKVEIGAIGFIWIGLGISQVLVWYLNKPARTEQAGLQD